MCGRQIKAYLDENGIKQSFLAEETKIPRSILNAMLNGKRKITVEEYFEICNALRLNANYFAEKMCRAS